MTILAEKKRKRRSRISKKDEKTLNEKIALGVGTTFIFLSIFLLTYSLIDRPVDLSLEPDTPYEEMTNEEKFEYIQDSDQKISDQTNYQLAVTLGDRTHCKPIKDDSLKSQCISDTPFIDTRERIEVEDVKSDQQIVDETNYQLAVTLGDSKYCKDITDSDLQSKCESELKA